jgi:hypothetical protein
VSQAEHPDRLKPGRDVTIEDVRSLMGASTPHFALQLRNRIRTLIRDLPPEHPARIEGEREIARLNGIAYTGEVRGHEAEAGLRPLPSLSTPRSARRLPASDGADAADPHVDADAL